MILKYRTTSLSSPPHTSFSYIDNISHFSPTYNPATSTLTVNLTLRYPQPYPSFYPPIHPSVYFSLNPVPTSLVLNDLAFLLTDDGRFLDKVFDPNLSSHSSNSSDSQNPSNSSYSSYHSHHQKPYKSYNKSYYKKPYYKSQPHSNDSLEDTDTSDITDSPE